MEKEFLKHPALLLLCGVVAAWFLSPGWACGKDWLPIPGKDLLRHKDADYYLEAGYRDFQSGARQAAIDEFTKAIEMDPSLVAAYDARASAQFQMKDYGDAIMDCDKAIGLTHEDEHVYLLKGACRYYLHDIQGALKPLNTAVLMNTNDTMALYLRGAVLVEFRKWDDAVVDFNRAIERNPSDGQAYFGRASAELLLKEYEKSLADVSDALELLDNNTLIGAAYAIRAVVKTHLKDRAGAFADANARIKLDTSNDKGYVTRASVEILWDEFSDASNDLQIAIQINPTNSQIYLCRAAAEQKCGNFKAALADYSRGLADNPDALAASVYESMGYAQAEMGHWQPALEAFRKAISFNSPPEGASLQIFLIESRLGQTLQAEKDLTAYIQSVPVGKAHDWTTSEAHFLAGSLNETDFLSQATTTAKRPSDISRQKGDAWYYAGMQHLLAGDNAGAAERFKTSLKVGDDNSDNYMMARSMVGFEMPSTGNIQQSKQPQSDVGK